MILLAHSCRGPTESPAVSACQATMGSSRDDRLGGERALEMRAPGCPAGDGSGSRGRMVQELMDLDDVECLLSGSLLSSTHGPAQRPLFDT